MTTGTSTLQLRTPSGPVDIARVGLGTYQLRGDVARDMVAAALATGYRHLDTAALYRNEEEVGAGIRASSVTREEVFVTSKLWHDRHGDARAALVESLGRLGLEHLDLYLIHWPAPQQGQFVEAWEALRAARDEGLVRVIGVSNFLPEHLQALRDATGEWPAVNQVELHPAYPQRELRAFHAEHGIVTEAWSPLAQGGDILGDPVVQRVASELGATAAQVVLGWSVQLGNVVLPRTSKPERLAGNLDLPRLDEEQMSAMAGLETGVKVGPDPLAFPE